MNPISLRLPYPISSNEVWARTGRGMRKSDAYNGWLKEVGYMLNRQKPGTVKGKYKLSIDATRPDKRRRDIDNIIGSVSDALQAFGVIENDYLCESISARWVSGEPGVSVSVEPVDAD